MSYEVNAGIESEFVPHTNGPSSRTPAWKHNLDHRLQHPPAVSALFRHTPLPGCCRHLAPLYAPTPNSYKRVQSRSFGPHPLKVRDASG
ncbi:hypothetical protein [Streptomyces sp. NPDC005799]|uniref:hypothetical protein n=1 Tax=Streptomyces sp. NPDC005799 TaxID=3154678 RepID=UPI0033F384F7